MENKRFIRLHLAMIISLVFFIALDQLTKLWAIKYLMPIGKNSIDIFPGVLELRYLENKGAAFGILQNQQWIFLVLTVLLIIAMVYIYFKMPFEKKYWLLRWTMLILMAGAIGNAIDRIRFQYVVDFIYFSLINFPIFNVADIYVTCSIFVLVISFLFFYKEEDLEIFKKK